MIRVLLFLILASAAAAAAVWLADRPGEVLITWQGWRLETSVMVLTGAVVLAALISVLLWSALRWVVGAPAVAARALRRRREARAELAVMRGLLAIGAGDARAASEYARAAQQLSARQPLALLLYAQAAQIAGDRGLARRVFQAMTGQEETRLLGLHGLFVEARRDGNTAAARHFAEDAAQADPALPWAAQAVLEFRCADGDWESALANLDANLAHGLIAKPAYQRQAAVLLTARALALENTDPAAAQAAAVEALRFAPDLVPAATLAARLLAAAGETRFAARVLMAAWRANPHPELAETYAHLRPGESARERLARIQSLVRERDDHREAALALARAAIEAREFTLARDRLERLLHRPSQRVALLMAELERQEHGDEGRARQWTARAVQAPRDPVWTADGVVSERWLPLSPLTGRIDAFEWKTPLEELPGHAKLISGQRSNGEDLDRNTPASPNPGAQSGALTVAPVSTSAPEPSAASAAEHVLPLVHVPDDPGIVDARKPHKTPWRRLGVFFK